jgi:hypothetical protein
MGPEKLATNPASLIDLSASSAFAPITWETIMPSPHVVGSLTCTMKPKGFIVPKKGADKLEQLLKVKEREKKQ